jgi:succinoglycan biosynthesis transport protein ExoP
MSGNVETLDLTSVIRRQMWLIASCVAMGVAAALIYCMNTTVLYESTAKVMVSQKNPRLATGVSGANQATDEMLNEDILANHMEIVSSRKIVEDALKGANLESLPSIAKHLDEQTDATDYVIEHLKLTKGGRGGAKDARSLTMKFQHDVPEDAKYVLSAVVREYQAFLGTQLESAMSSANNLVKQAQQDVEREIEKVEAEYVELRSSAPVLFQGEGSSNIYLDQFRRLNDEMLELQIQESAIQTRLKRVEDVLTKRDQSEVGDSKDDDFELLALIDSTSLERIGVFASLQMNSAKSADFLASQPVRLEEARTQYSHLLQLMSHEQKLRTDFAENHPEVVKIRGEIELVKEFIDNNSEQSSVAGEQEVNPELMTKAYVGFLKHDLATIDEKQRELKILADAAESKAKSLVAFELKHESLKGQIERRQLLYDGIVEQLRNLNMASGVSGLVHVLLESPRLGAKVWPRLPLCGLGGMFLGLMAGLVLAIANDQLDKRFHSNKDFQDSIDIPIVGHIGRQAQLRNIQGLMANARSMEAEEIRKIRTVLLPKVKAGELKTLMTTSPMSQDGKSTIQCSLAVSFAQLKIEVLLIDADMRRPSAHELLSVPLEDGLAEVLEGSLGPVDAIKPTKMKHLSIMSAGTSPLHPSELLESERFDELLETLSEQYQLILVDVGPVLAVADPCVISRMTDATLLVVRPNITHEQIQDTMEHLRSVGAPLIGCVVNMYGAKGFKTTDAYYGNYAQAYGNYAKAMKRTVQKDGDGELHGEVIAPRMKPSSKDNS